MAQPYLLKRHDWYYLRIRVPKDLIPYFSRKEVWKSLRTKCYKTAKSSVKKALHDVEQIFLTARYEMNILPNLDTLTNLNVILEEEAQAYLLSTEAMRSNPDFRLAEEEMMRQNEALRETFREVLHSRRYEDIEPSIEEFKHRKGLDLEKGTPDYNFLARSLLTTYIRMLDIEIERSKGNYENEVDRLLKPDLSRPRLPGLVPDPPVGNLAPHGQSSSMKLSEAIDLMLRENKSSLAKRTYDAYLGYKPIVLRITGDKPVRSYTRQDFLDARDLFSKVPKYLNRIAVLKDEPIESILQQKDLGPPLAERTVLKYLTFLSTVFNYCEESQLVAKSLCPNWKKSKELAKDNGWEAWSPKDLVKLFKGPYYKKQVRTNKPQNFWIPIIALLSGMRVNEICQLYKEDIVKKEGLDCFHLNDEKDKTLKNASSYRVIPIHPIILELGFMDYLDSVDHERVWPKLILGKNGYCTAFSKSMGKHIRRHVTNNPKKVFHSLRDNFASTLRNQGHDDSFIGAFLGHAPQNKTTSSYAGAYPLSLMLEAMQEMDFGFDLKAIISEKIE